MKVTIQKRIEVEEIPEQILEKAEEILDSLQDEVFIALKHLCNQVDKNRGNLEATTRHLSDLESVRVGLQDIIDNFEDLSNFMAGYQNVLSQLEAPQVVAPAPAPSPSPDIHPGLAEKVAELQKQHDTLQELTETEEGGEQ